MTNPNDLAFQTHVWSKNKDGSLMFAELTPGLTKREYLAGLAMQALVSNSANFDFFQRAKIHPKEVREETAKTAIQFADALIAELSK